MKPTAILNINAWASKIHPPLPLTDRQSRQLLNLLTSSFRTQLDKQHPPVENRGDDVSRKPRPAAHHEQQKNLSDRATDRHLRDILDHPLFSVSPGPTRASRPNQADDASRKRLAEEPMIVFDEQAAAGAMNAQTLQACFDALKKIIRKESESLARADPRISSKVAYIEGLKLSGAAEKILRLFNASDIGTRMAFLQKRSTVDAIMPFLIAARQEKMVGGWLKMLFEADASGAPSLTQKELQDIQLGLMQSLFHYEISSGRGLATAITHYARICRYLDLVNGPAALANGHLPLNRMGRHVLKWLVMHSHDSSVKSLSIEAFEAFIQLRQRWSRKGFPSNKDFWAATLPLYHPTTPSAGIFLDFLANQSKDWVNAAPEDSKRLILRVTLDAARVLLDQERFRAAAFLMDFAKQNFPVDLELENLEKIASPEPERESSYDAILHELEIKYV